MALSLALRSSLSRPALGILALALASCGGLVDTDPSAASEAPRPSENPAHEPPSPGPGREPARPPPSEPRPPSQVLRCAFSDGAFYMTGPGMMDGVELVVRIREARVVAYVSNGVELRRYKLATESPCVLERDLDFGPNGKLPARDSFAIDEDDGVWISSGDRVRRVHPGAVLNCTMDPAYKDAEGNVAFAAGPLYLDPEGKTGWALGGPAGMLGRLTLGATACSVLLTPAPYTFSLRANTPHDAQGRLHVIDAPTAGVIGVFTSAGVLVKSYAGKSASTDPAPLDVTRCAGGVCVLGSDPTAQSLTYLDDDGVARAATPTIKGLRARRISADRVGPVFLAGATDSSMELDQVVVQVAPSPP